MFFQPRSEQRELSLGNGSNQISLALVNGQLVPTIDGVISPDHAIYNSDIFSCINLISSDVAAAQWRVKGGKDDNLLRIIGRSPNRVTNAFTFWQSVLVTLLLNGNCYVLIYRSKFDNSPTKLEYLKPEWIDVIQSDDSQQLYYDITPDDHRDSFRVDSTDILHFRLLSKDGGLTGISPLLALRPEVSIQDQTNKLSLSAMTQAINPNGILNVEASLLDKDGKDNIRNEFEKANSGINAGRVMILDSTMSFTPSSVDAQVLKVLQQTDWTRQQIAKAFAVPMDMLNQESQHSNIDQIKGLYATCLSRYTNPIINELTNKLCKQGQSVYLDISSIIDPYQTDLINTLGGAVNNGLYTADQAIALINQAKGV